MAADAQSNPVTDDMSEAVQLPRGRLLVATGCPHCSSVRRALEQLVAEGRLAALEVIDLSRETPPPELAGIRSVPYVELGDFAFEGQLTLGELRHWVARVGQAEGWSEFFAHLLEHRRLDDLVQRLRQSPQRLPDLIRLLASLDTPMGVRIGVGAVLEELAEDDALLLEAGVSSLVQLTRAEAEQVRADACHYLSLTAHPQARAALEAALNDSSAEVREIAAESLELLDAAN